MARDDDDDDQPKTPRDEEDDDRPRKKNASDEDDRRSDADDKPMPLRLVGAIIASLGWGGYMLHASCLTTSFSVLGILQILRRQEIGFMNHPALGQGDNFFYATSAASVLILLMSATLFAGGVALLMRKGFGKFMVMGGPAGIALVELGTFVVCLMITSGLFLTHYNVQFLVTIVFSLAVAGLNVYLLMNKDVAKALK